MKRQKNEKHSQKSDWLSKNFTNFLNYVKLTKYVSPQLFSRKQRNNFDSITPETTMKEIHETIN